MLYTGHDDASPALQPLVRRGEIAEPSRRHGPSAASCTHLAFEIGRLDAPCPGPVDVGHRRVRVELDSQFLEAFTDEPQAIGGQHGHGLVACDGTVTQQPQRDAVERARLDGLVDLEPAQPAAQLTGGIAGERECNHVLRLGVSLFDPVGDPAGQDRCLPRAGGGHDGQWLGIGLDGASLVGVEPHQQSVHRHVDTIRRLARLLGPLVEFS